MQIIEAAKKNNYSLLQKALLEEPNNINSTDQYIRTALHIFIVHGNLEAVELLLSKGALVNTQDKFKTSPIHSAVTGNHVKITEILLENGANPEVKNATGLTPAHLAASNGSVKILELLEPGCDLNATNNFNATPLHSAALGIKNEQNQQCWEAIKWLIARNVNYQIEMNGNISVLNILEQSQLPYDDDFRKLVGLPLVNVESEAGDIL